MYNIFALKRARFDYGQQNKHACTKSVYQEYLYLGPFKIFLKRNFNSHYLVLDTRDSVSRIN